MQLALELAKSAKGQTSPNPVVGAVVVKDGQVVGMGAHLRAGEPHAEVHAIQMAKEKAKGATIYVTLEPCSHFGKTPPCADLIIESGLRHVIVATVDPNPKVAGKGVEKLKAAGIEVEVGLLEQEAIDINAVFFHYMKTKKPFVTLKSATSLDGKIATVTGESKWITSDEARVDVHRYRHEHDAILVGVGTVLADNPSLTTRLEGGGKNPIRIILDSRLRTPLNSNVVLDGEAPTWIVTTTQADESKKLALQEKGVQVIVLSEKQISIEKLLEMLGERGVTSLFVEGGAEIHGSFVAGGYVNQMITYLAPKLIGGKSAPTSVGGSGRTTIEQALSLTIESIEKIGPDVKIISRLKGDS